MIICEITMCALHAMVHLVYTSLTYLASLLDEWLRVVFKLTPTTGYQPSLPKLFLLILFLSVLLLMFEKKCVGSYVKTYQGHGSRKNNMVWYCVQASMKYSYHPEMCKTSHTYLFSLLGGLLRMAFK